MNAAHGLIPPQSSRRLRDDNPLARLRSQAAFVRALLDEVERVSSPGSQDAMTEQLAEELTRLGRQFLEVASTFGGADAEPECA